ncbi:DUF4349 domain-containing protein [Streptoalloteichus hindustanus]|uniref:ABC-type phosphate transport system, auxiliary component n=1 Tax=Streptoalloteichus hindustanus TaxID=2017 RepID=A0A1M4TZ80_STRHI|nr:DUF4349 domain-containing protein [Streptoalloteichus hindustanus]SHE49730.1 ABC-type phosphate transport system, auxiliary component [Streptoalloteichus hindustanus]
MGGRWLRPAAVAVLLLGLAGCTGTGSPSSAPQRAEVAAGNAPAGKNPERNPGQNPEKNAVPGGGAGQGGAQAPGEGAVRAAAQADRRVIRSAELEVRHDDAVAAVARAREVGTRAGGFAAAEDTRGGQGRVTLRVPADRLDGVLDELGRLGELVRREQRAEDVTDQLVDVQARLAAQRASVDRVRALLERAGTVSEVVQVEGELAKRQAELESLQRRNESLAGQVALSTVVFRVASAPTSGGDADGFVGGLGAGWRAFTAAVGAALTALGAMLPFLVALGVPAAGVLWVLRRRRRTARPALAPNPEA